MFLFAFGFIRMTAVVEPGAIFVSFLIWWLFSVYHRWGFQGLNFLLNGWGFKDGLAFSFLVSFSLNILVLGFFIFD